MKTAKLIIGIISIVLAVFVMFQSMIAGLGNSLSSNGEISGSAGFLVALFMIISGIVGITTRNGGRGGSIATSILFIFAFLIGISNYGSYSDLKIWSYLCLIFSVVFFISAFGKKRDPISFPTDKAATDQEENQEQKNQMSPQ